MANEISIILIVSIYLLLIPVIYVAHLFSPFRYFFPLSLSVSLAICNVNHAILGILLRTLIITAVNGPAATMHIIHGECLLCSMDVHELLERP